MVMAMVSIEEINAGCEKLMKHGLLKKRIVNGEVMWGLTEKGHKFIEWHEKMEGMK